MLNTLIGMYLSDKYNITTDRILFAQSVPSNSTQTFTLTNATNGVKLKADLASLDYFIYKYTIWSQNGIVDIIIKPDNESVNQVKTLALTQKTEAPIIPAKYMQADITIEATNSQLIDDDIFIVLDILKIQQTKVGDIVDIGKVLCTSPDNIDIQTLAIEKYIIYTNELLKALILANKGSIPGVPDFVGDLPTSIKEPAPKTQVCRRQ